MTEVVASSTTYNCGPLSLEFFNDDATQSSLDETLFLDDRANAPQNAFTVLQAQATDGEMHLGAHAILYRVFYAEYPDVRVDQTAPFTIEVVNPCDMPSENSIQVSAFEDQEYTITGNAVTYQIPPFVSSLDWCDITYSSSMESSLENSMAVSFNTDTMELSIENLDDLSLSGSSQ